MGIKKKNPAFYHFLPFLFPPSLSANKAFPLTPNCMQNDVKSV